MLEWLNTNRTILIWVLVAVFVVAVIWQLHEEHFPSITDEQKKWLDKLHPKERLRFYRFVDKAQRDTGWTFVFTSTYRTFQHQARLKAENSKNASPGNSYHNYGLAIDLNLVKDGQRIRKADSVQKWLDTGVPQIGEKMGFTWGGRFDSYHDPVHFDVRSDYSISKLKEQAIKQFGSLENTRGNEVLV